MRKLTPKQEAKVEGFMLAAMLSNHHKGALVPNFVLARKLVRLEQLGRILRSRFEGICSFPYCNEPPYLVRTDRLVDEARQLIATFGKCVVKNEINRDPRGAAIKLTVRNGKYLREFFL